MRKNAALLSNYKNIKLIILIFFIWNILVYALLVLF